MIDPGDFVIYGVAWMLVGMALLYTVNYFSKLPLDEKVERVIQAIWAVVGYFLINNLEPLENLWPGMPIVLPQILLAILLFGGMLGFQPGTMFRFVTRLFKKKRGSILTFLAIGMFCIVCSFVVVGMVLVVEAIFGTLLG